MRRIWKYLRPFLWLLLAILFKMPFMERIIESIATLFIHDLTAEQMVSIKQSVVNVAQMLSWFPLAFSSAKNGLSGLKYKELRKEVFLIERKNLVSILQNERLIKKGIGVADINIRIFQKRGKNLIFIDVPGCYSYHIRGKTKFSISKDEGLVTLAYKSDEIKYEILDGYDPKYHLSKEISFKIDKPRFILAVPILNQKNTKYVISFDSLKQICDNEIYMNRIIAYMKVCARNVYDYYTTRGEELE